MLYIYLFLSRLQNRGVVQLFNAVKRQQKDIEEKLSSSSESKKEKIIKSINKGSFLDILKGTAIDANKKLPNEEVKVSDILVLVIRPFQVLFLFPVRGRVGFWPSTKKKKRKMFLSSPVFRQI